MDGRKSIGSFKNSEENGWVKQIYPNGDYFSGFIADNQIDQFGCYQWMNGNRYEGEWKQDVLHGIGCYTNIEESAVGKVIITMEGTFKKGSLNGYGYCKNSKADYEYYGEVSDDKSVWGHFTYEDGMEYDGDTFHLTRHGVGQLSYTKTPLVLLDNAGDAEEINPFNIDHVNTFADLIESIQTYGGTYVGCFDRDIPHGSGDLFLMNQQYMMSFDHGIVRKL